MSDQRIAPSPVGQTTGWRVHERGRLTHWIVDGVAGCGEPGTRWRAIAGVPRCPACERLAGGRHHGA